MLQHHRLQATMNSFVIHGFSIYLFLQVTLTSAYTDFMVFSHLCVLVYVLFKLKDLDLSEMVLLFFSCVLLLTYIDFSLGFFWKKFTLMTQFLSFERCNAYFENAFWKFHKSPLKLWFGSLYWCNNTVQVFRGFQPNLNQTGSQVSSLFLNVENVQEMVFVLLPQICQAPVYLCGSK